MKRILLMIIGFTLLGTAGMVRVNEVVEDTVAGLQWQDTLENQSLQMEWDDAIAYCEELFLDGHDDWRLPNINELFSLVDFSKVSPAISEGFQHLASGHATYWSSTADAFYHTYHHYARWYIINFEDGMQLVENRSYEYVYVRCVRSSRP